MADREKVLKGLERCVISDEEGVCPDDCPYYDECWADKIKIEKQLKKDALALLKAQQPRVLTLEEARNHEVVWAEDRQNDDVSMCVVQRNMNDSKLYKYGVQWRVWSARPTDAEREAVAWE